MEYFADQYYYDGYNNFMKGKSQWWPETLTWGSKSKESWMKGRADAEHDFNARLKAEKDKVKL